MCQIQLNFALKKAFRAFFSGVVHIIFGAIDGFNQQLFALDVRVNTDSRRDAVYFNTDMFDVRAFSVPNVRL